MRKKFRSSAGRWSSLVPPALLMILICAWFIAVSEAGGLTPASRRLWAGLTTIMAYLAFCYWVYRHWRAARPSALANVMGSAADTVLVAFASQTGFAEQLAEKTAAVLMAGGQSASLRSLSALSGESLAVFRRVLFVVSTTGEGDAPDAVAGFARKTMSLQLPLAGLEYGLLALGDSSYRHYCAFGLELENWLHRQGARALFDTVKVDDGDEGALRHWQHHLGVLSGHTDIADWSVPSYCDWTLVERRHLNSGSPGLPVFHIALAPIDGACAWQAGDIVEVGPCNPWEPVDQLLAELALTGEEIIQERGSAKTLRACLAQRLLPRDQQGWIPLKGCSAQALADALEPIPHREYSIASLPVDGRLELLVRQALQADGRLGFGSGWLTRHAAIGGRIALRIRENRGFHPPPAGRPLILIGNGTGMAGLRAHLKARAAAGLGRNWLLFGERTSAHDFFYRDEIQGWRDQGLLARLDLAFSREAGAHRYVQDCLADAGATLREWVKEGAAIYVCGSLQGMASGVTAKLEAALGRECLDEMAEDGRYRRDVY